MKFKVNKNPEFIAVEKWTTGNSNNLLWTICEEERGARRLIWLSNNFYQEQDSVWFYKFCRTVLGSPYKLFEADDRDIKIYDGLIIITLQLCGSVSYPLAANVRESPFYPLTSPSRMAIVLNKKDTHSAYNFEARMLNEKV